ncbi:MAG: hypothetical protein BMS9Abin31_0149 [Gammaproteobacteria bacterium]|nr:MAG: hypothetical protein BMS9Abin31_0149 [Gammaproteobacteria bacterium]
MFSWIPSPSTIKYGFMIGVSFIAVILWALLSVEKKERAQGRVKALKRTREVERETLIIQNEHAENREGIIQNAKDNIDNPDYNPFK